MNLQELIKEHDLKVGDEVICVQHPVVSTINKGIVYKLTEFDGFLVIKDFFGLIIGLTPGYIFIVNKNKE